MSIKALLAVTLCAATAAFAADKQTIAYPTKEHASFTIEAPSDWELTPAEEEGGFFDLVGPSGATFSFRTIEGTKDSLNEAIKESLDEINKRFDAVKMGDAEDWKPGGMEGFYSKGDGKHKDDGSAVRIGVGWVALADDRIAEFWFVADADDDAGQTTAGEIANSLRAP